MSDSRGEVVATGMGGQCQLVACRECGVLLWDIDAHYAHAHQALDGAPEPDNYDQCDAEVYSWDHYRPEQIDSYWIRCTLLGKHDEHEDSHTGLKWRCGLPVEGEKP